MERPVFVVGCGRSGTTLLYEVLAAHPDLGWFSNWTDRYPSAPQLAALSRAFPYGSHVRRTPRLAPRPAEGYRIWSRCCRDVAHLSMSVLSAADLTAGDAARIREVVAAHLRFHGRSRFVNKNTANSRRVGYLRGVFPDALVVHVVRNPVDTVASLLRVPFWPDLQVWVAEGATPSEWASSGRDPAELGARLWVAEVTAARDAGTASPATYLEIRYEDLLADPAQSLSEVLGFAGLEWTRAFQKRFGRFAFERRSGPHARSLSEAQIEAVTSITSPTASLLRYT